jgi:hypothetical protein
MGRHTNAPAGSARALHSSGSALLRQEVRHTWQRAPR